MKYVVETLLHYIVRRRHIKHLWWRRGHTLRFCGSEARWWIKLWSDNEEEFPPWCVSNKVKQPLLMGYSLKRKRETKWVLINLDEHWHPDRWAVWIVGWLWGQWRWKSLCPVNDIVTWVGFKAIQTAAGGAKETSQVRQQFNSSERPCSKASGYI